MTCKLSDYSKKLEKLKLKSKHASLLTSCFYVIQVANYDIGNLFKTRIKDFPTKGNQRIVVQRVTTFFYHIFEEL